MSEAFATGPDVDDLQEEVAGVIRRTLDVPAEALPLTPETPLLGAGLGVDSIDVLQLVAALEEAFGLAIGDPDLTLENFATVGGVVGVVRRRLARAG